MQNDLAAIGNSKKTIFITGISGLLGANIAYLLRDEYIISGIDRNTLNIAGIDAYIESVLNFNFLKQIIDKIKPDYIIHCAAFVNVDGCESAPVYAKIIHCDLTEFLCDICSECNIKLILISTDAVFDGKKKGLNTEDDPIQPISIYGKTKATAEQIVLKDPRNLVIRTNIYGYNHRNRSSFGEWIKNSLEDGAELNMVNDIRFSPIVINEFVDILNICIHQNVCGLYHICCTDAISKYDIALEMRKQFGFYAPINSVSMKSINYTAPRTQNMGLDNTKIKKRLGIEILTPIEGVTLFKRLWDEGYSQKLKAGGFDE